MTTAKHWKREDMHTVTPRLIFKDVRKAVKFYADTFDAQEGGLFMGPDGKTVIHDRRFNDMDGRRNAAHGL